ncbi:alpha/beta hydrolase family protein [Blastopirellula retiformator]|uniref:Esterase n=1 Tax=Blastopirellula retiformator TaxID=2527970 RepID=A0A5C5V2W9_9BACT|nr:prolyl oligopeptidase family serine peptidase [Blastopirellula retiformator]TWT32035.1 esterase [Blastopirellula retiformator]
MSFRTLAARVLFIVLTIGATEAYAVDLSAAIGESFAAADTLADIQEENADAKACLEGLCWPRGQFAVDVEAAAEEKGDALVRFPSARTTSNPTNDRVAMQWYAARDEEGHAMKAPAIIVVHESGSGMTVGQVMAKGLRNQGFHTFMIQLPGYGLRKVPGEKKNGAEFLIRMKQSIADVRRARDAVAALPLVDADHIAVQGTSLGGFVASDAAALDDGFDSVFLLLSGGDLHDIIHHGHREAAEVRKRLEAAGIQGEALVELINTIEPLRIAHRLDPKRTWLYNGTYDQVVPLENGQALAAAAHLAPEHHVQLSANHYSGVVFIPYVLTHIRSRIDAVEQPKASD